MSPKILEITKRMYVKGKITTDDLLDKLNSKELSQEEYDYIVSEG